MQNSKQAGSLKHYYQIWSAAWLVLRKNLLASDAGAIQWEEFIKDIANFTEQFNQDQLALEVAQIVLRTVERADKERSAHRAAT